MGRTRWRIDRTETRLRLFRPGRGRLDVWAETGLPGGRPDRIASQVRQDIWRAARSVRGFSPVVEVTAAAGMLRLRAGGQVDGPVPPGLPGRLQEVLTDPARRRRWLTSARERRR